MNDTNDSSPKKINDCGGREFREVLEQIAASLHGLRFGSVNIVVQDGVVVQIDRTEKQRLRRKSES